MYLCTEIEGATVIWSSDKPDVISETGIVTRSDETNIVRLTAVIKSNDYSMDIDFDVRVVKNTYDGYNTDYIYDMDSLELLYIYNDDPDNLEVYLNDEGYITELNGQFSEFIVESPEEAFLALYEIKSLMGCEDPIEQLVWEKTSKDNYGYSYRFHQVVDGIPVYGTNIVVSTDLAGVTTALHSSFVTDLDIDLENVISESEARAVVEENAYSFIAFEGLVVYVANDVHLVYNVNCRQDLLEYNVLVAAQGGVDTVGHEFTHAIVKNETDLASNYNNAPGAINEGYADIFGYFAEGDNDPDWNHGEDNHKNPIRVMSNPNSKSMPTSVGGSYYYDFTIAGNTKDHGGVHTNNSVISYPCYLMWSNGISDKSRLANLWYTSLRYGYDSNASFDNVRVNVLRAAKAMGMSGQEIEIIKSAFDTAGISGPTATAITGTNVLFGKVVIADIDMTAGNNIPLTGATVTLTRRGTSTPIPTISVNDGTFKFYDLRPGTYTLNVSKIGYWSTEQIITLTSAKMTNYCSTIELIPQKYIGDGIATGIIKDSVTGSGVEGLTLNVRKGMNTKTGYIVCQTTTDNLGKYELKLDTGHYCVEVVDKRTLEEGQKKYYSTYFNIKVLGGVTVANHILNLVKR